MSLLTWFGIFGWGFAAGIVFLACAFLFADWYYNGRRK